MTASTWASLHPWDYPDCPACGGHLFVEHVHDEGLTVRPGEDTFTCYAGWCDGGRFVASTPLRVEVDV